QLDWLIPQSMGYSHRERRAICSAHSAVASGTPSVVCSDDDAFSSPLAPSHLWAKTNMTRRHGRCSRGARLVAKVPQGRWRTLTFLAALRCDRITAPCVIDGPINGTSFRAYIEQFLVPTLSHGDVVVMDNLGSHKSKAVRRLIRSAGAKLFFLPRS